MKANGTASVSIVTSHMYIKTDPVNVNQNCAEFVQANWLFSEPVESQTTKFISDWEACNTIHKTNGSDSERLLETEKSYRENDDIVEMRL